MWPGAFSTTRYAEPLAGIRAAQTVQRTAGRVADDYVRHAREEGIGWREIGEALGLAEDGKRTGYALAVAAYEQVTGEPDVLRDPASTTPARRASGGSATGVRTKPPEGQRARPRRWLHAHGRGRRRLAGGARRRGCGVGGGKVSEPAEISAAFAAPAAGRSGHG